MFAVSAVTGEGCRELMWAVHEFLARRQRARDSKRLPTGDVRFERAAADAR